MKKLLFLVPLLFVLSCTSSANFERGKKQLQSQGYKQIESTGWKLWCCSEEDQFSNGFKAISPKGEVVTGCFCSSPFKGTTTRFK